MKMIFISWYDTVVVLASTNRGSRIGKINFPRLVGRGRARTCAMPRRALCVAKQLNGTRCAHVDPTAALLEKILFLLLKSVPSSSDLLPSCEIYSEYYSYMIRQRDYDL